jgi:predicted nucleic acid-binding Zn ribbon protein
MSDDPLISCQTCEAPVERVFHPVAVHFKGSGFYTTDYGSRRRQRESGESGDSGGGEKSDSKSESKSDTSTSTSTKSESSD